jgi:hypothetical protein
MSKKLAVPKRRPARIQVDPEEFEEELPPQSGTVFNIWYNKWSGGASGHTLVQSKYKLDVDRDSGYTKGDKQGKGYFCLFFAKGMCCKGKNCEYIHRIPNDDDIFPLTVDCFGREKFSEYRDDMSGVGNFNTVNKTLYIGGVLNKDGVQDVINREFRKLGKISKINVIAGKNCAFVTYKNESNAQFAKEVMHGQSLYGTDILNVKWAHEDPNPEAVRQKKRQLEEETQQVVLGLLEKYDSKRVRVNEEPLVEEPEETMPQKVKEAMKQIEAPKTGILSGTALEGLKLLKKPLRQPGPLVGGYESSDDE